MDKETAAPQKKRFWIVIAIYAVLFLAIVLVANREQLDLWVRSVLRLFRPLLIGLALAYLCNPFFRFFERALFCKLRPPALRRTLSLIMTYLSVLLIIALILLLILPQLFSSIAEFAGNYRSYLQSATNQINRTIAAINGFFLRIANNEQLLTPLEPNELGQRIAELFGTTTESLLDSLTKLDMKPIASIIESAMSVLTDSLFGFFISLYLLSTKEKRYAQIMKVRHALFTDAVNGRITRFCTIADRSFGGFIEGKLLDSLIVGLLVYVLLLIFGIPYAILISSFIAVANVIPIIGPLLGALPAAIILLLSDPTKVIPFLVIIIVVQQIDGNIISPKILGSNTGVSSLCVVIAIATTGALWGLAGMVLGVPLFATVLEMTDEYLTRRLQQKGMPSGVENYYATDSIVDPAVNAHVTTDRTMRKFERYALRVKRETEDGKRKTRWRKLVLNVYDLLLKHKVIKELSDEEHARFSAEEAHRQALKEVDERIDEHRRLAAEEEFRLTQERRAAEQAAKEDTPSDTEASDSTEAPDVTDVTDNTDATDNTEKVPTEIDKDTDDGALPTPNKSDGE